MKPPRHLIACLTIAAILIAAVGNVQIKADPLPGACNCIIFKLDEVQDSSIDSVQSVVIDKFTEKNGNLSLGIIMNNIGNDPVIGDKLK